MSFACNARKLLVAAGLLTLTLSLVLDPGFATDQGAPSVPEPATMTLLAVAGAGGIAAGLIRRRRK